MAKYYEIFTKDKEKQQVSLGQCKVVLVRGFTKDNDIYHRVDIVSNDNIRLLSQFIKIENLGYYLHVAGNNNSLLNTLYNQLGYLIEYLEQVRDIKSINKNKLVQTLKECLALIEKDVK